MFPVTTELTAEFKVKERFAHIITLLYVVPPLPAPPGMQRKVRMKWTGPSGLPKEKRPRALKEVWYLFRLKELTGSREMARDKKMACVGKKATLQNLSPDKEMKTMGDPQMPTLNS